MSVTAEATSPKVQVTDLSLGSPLTTILWPRASSSESRFLCEQSGNKVLVTSLLGELKGDELPKCKVPSGFSYWEFSRISLWDVAPNFTVFTAPSPASCRKSQNHNLGVILIIQQNISLNQYDFRCVIRAQGHSLLFSVPILVCVPADAARPNVPSKSQIINLNHINVPHSDRQVRF